MDPAQKEQERREARRRKILENAKNRLGRITGREINGMSRFVYIKPYAMSNDKMFATHTQTYNNSQMQNCRLNCVQSPLLTPLAPRTSMRRK